jgi:hypothetical protein
MTGPEDDRDLEALDAHIRTQLAEAAKTYVSHVNLDARLKAILQAETGNGQDETVTEKD